jgi:flagellum-specific ATP synthase
MDQAALDRLRTEIAGCRAARPIARVSEVGRGLLRLAGTGRDWRTGDRVTVHAAEVSFGGEVVVLDGAGAGILTDQPPDGVRIGDGVELIGPGTIAPHEGWIGRIVDPFGQPLDGRPLMRGGEVRALRASAPPPAARKRLGGRLETGLCVFNTLLPLVRGQRIGLFAGSGVGKSMLLASLARGVDADVTVLALIGERGREVREFAEDVLGPEGLARSVIIAATSDQSPLIRRRCAWAAMAAAEHFRDQGRQVLFHHPSGRGASRGRPVGGRAAVAARLPALDVAPDHVAGRAGRAGTGGRGRHHRGLFRARRRV